MRPFYLYKNNCGYFVVVFVDPVTGKKRVGKSTHSKDRVEATMIASSWLQNGEPSARSNERAFSQNALSISTPVNLEKIANRVTATEALQLVNMLCSKFNLVIPQNLIPQSQPLLTSSPLSSPIPVSSKASVTPCKKQVALKRIKLCEFLDNFWDYDESEFIQRYIAHGNNMTRRHTSNMQSLVKNYWVPYFGLETYVDELDKTMLDDFFFYLYHEKGLKGGTVNKAINCGSRAIRYLFENNKISVNPMAGVERFNPNQLDRGIPTESEVRQLLDLDWSNEAYKLAFKLGIFCGLRAGEISGLRVCDLDLDADIIHIRHSWSDTDGLKCPKNSDVRDLPIDHATLLQLYSMAKENPQFSDLSYVFYSPVKPEQPYWPSYYIDGLYEALEKIGISEEQRKERNIVFHSLRHFCATVLSQRTDIKTVQAFMGHRTEAMSKHYSDHETKEKLENMKNIMQLTWDKILSA